MSKTSLLRDRGSRDGGKVGMVELFFDLVFVFAVTQLSHTLLQRLTPAGALQTLLLFLAVWWLWIYTSWFTNFLDPARHPVRLLLFALMLGGLLLSSSIPHAFADKGLVFGAVFAAMQVGRTVFFVVALRRHGTPRQFRNFVRVLVWLMASAVFWVIGVSPKARHASAGGCSRSRSSTSPRSSTSRCRVLADPAPRIGTWTARTWPSAACCS